MIIDYNLFESIKNTVGTGGDCFISNANLLTTNLNDDWVLVHGYVLSTTRKKVRYIHCWVENEKENKVKDYSNGNTIEIDKRVYYAIGNIEKNTVKKYTHKEVLKNTLKYKHWGPWDLK